MQFVRNLRLAPLGRIAAAGSAAAAAATLSSHADAEPLNLTKRGSVMVAPSDSITEVVITARPVSQHIEEQQRELADSYADFSGDCSYEKALRALRSAFKLPSAELSRLSMHFRREAIKGLEGAPSSMQMIPTFVTKRVTGDEKGDFYALDLGGTNFRVLRLSLEGGGKVGAVKQAKFTISEATKTSDAAGLFGFLADSIATFLAKECGGNPSGDLGFTFSFPVTQTAINAGTLVMWNKGFTAAGVVGHDVVDLLQTALVARHQPEGEGARERHGGDDGGRGVRVPRHHNGRHPRHGDERGVHREGVEAGEVEGAAVRRDGDQHRVGQPRHDVGDERANAAAQIRRRNSAAHMAQFAPTAPRLHAAPAR